MAATALCSAMLLNPQAASAQQTIESLGLTVTTTPALTTNYLFRGISQTRNKPAGQVTIDVEHSSGFYIGAFVSNATFPNTNLRQEVDGSIGYRFSIGDLKLDLGGTYFGYPGYDSTYSGGFDWSWYELTARASYEIAPVKFVGMFSWSPNFNFESGNAYYVEGGFDMTLDFGITLAARAGYQWIEYNTSSPANHGAFGTPDYAVFTVAASREIVGGIIGTLGASITTLSNNECFGGTKLCGNRVLFTLSRPF
jgi:uncharacterized protein (TIGR02001 family)